jgi:hypothetical protein
MGCHSGLVERICLADAGFLLGSLNCGPRRRYVSPPLAGCPENSGGKRRSIARRLADRRPREARSASIFEAPGCARGIHRYDHCTGGKRA